ncbi:MAG: hypothetical protein ACTJHU_06840, partial [Mycetocola sp.]
VAGFPVVPAYAGLLPGGVLRHGAVYSVPRSLSIAVGLAAAASEQGAWCAVVGVPDFGVEAALAAGINRERLVLVPRPEAHVRAVLSALIDVVGVVIVGRGIRLSAGELSRVHARLRDRSASLIVADEWPQSEAVLRTQSVRWQGLGQGWGSLGVREVDVAVEARGQVGRQARAVVTFDLTGRALSAVPLRRGMQRAAVPLRGVTL